MDLNKQPNGDSYPTSLFTEWLFDDLLPLWKEYTVYVDEKNRGDTEYFGKMNRALLDDYIDRMKASYMLPGATAPPKLWNWSSLSVSMGGFLSWLADREVPDAVE